MSHYTALLDANVLYPAPLRDLFLQLAVTDIFKAKWSAGIRRAWIGAATFPKTIAFVPYGFNAILASWREKSNSLTSSRNGGMRCLKPSRERSMLGCNSLWNVGPIWDFHSVR